MFSRSAGLLATCCALGASAFLLPPHVTSEGTGKDIDLPFVEVNTKNLVLELPCSSCAFPAKQEDEVAEADDTLWIQGGANNLILNFTISEDGHNLELNKRTIYPIERSFEMSGEDMYIDQVAASTTREQLKSGDFRAVPLRVTGEGTGVGHAHEMAPNGDELISVKWQLLALESQPMTVNEVAIQLLRIESGELLLLSVEPIEKNMLDELPLHLGPPGPPHRHHGQRPHPPTNCKSLPDALCKFVNAVEGKIEAAKHGKFGKFGKHGGCPGRKGGRPSRLPGHIRPHLDFEGKGNGPHHGRPHHMRPHGGPPGSHGHHGHHGHHHRHHHFMHSFFRAFIAILIPVMAGIFVGLSVSLVGLIVGRSIGWLWVHVVRRGRRGSYASIAQNEVDAEEGEAKEFPVYVEETEAPPVYEDAPAYELSEKNNEH